MKTVVPSRNPGSFMSPMVNMAPSLASRSAVARPIPDAAPVTNIFLPLNRTAVSL